MISDMFLVIILGVLSFSMTYTILDTNADIVTKISISFSTIMLGVFVYLYLQ